MTEWFYAACRGLDTAARDAALARQAQLTKPAGSLGRIEDLAVTLAAMQAQAQPQLKALLVAVFAADHGIARSGVSAYPQAVTAEMIRNFSRGGAAISVLSRTSGAQLLVVNLGTVIPVGGLPGVLDRSIASGTANFVDAPAMSEQQCLRALAVGREVIANAGVLDLFVGGEMGIGNTAAATALTCALTGAPVASVCGRGTGIDDATLSTKIHLIEQALAYHACDAEDPLKILRCLGGFEIAALAGAYIACAQQGVPVLLDGFICTAAALVATRLNPGVSDWLIAGHCSEEPGHRVLLANLNKQPLLTLSLRLGEASGAALALPLLQAACNLHRNMATFDEAGVSRADDE